jgi:hypothetical protein
MMTASTDEDFQSFEWHDAVILNITIVRANPGERDEVMLQIRWPSEKEATVCFKDCYALEANMNFGIIASETIRSAECIRDSARLADIRRKWATPGVNLDDLKCFEIETASTASRIRIYARTFEAS